MGGTKSTEDNNSNPSDRVLQSENTSRGKGGLRKAGIRENEEFSSPYFVRIVIKKQKHVVGVLATNAIKKYPSSLPCGVRQRSSATGLLTTLKITAISNIHLLLYTKP